MSEKIKSLEELKQIRQNYFIEDKKVVWTNGCFDLLHPGHTSYLIEAKGLGDYLFVGLNSDESVKKLKKGRLINNEGDRAEVLSALESVDYITVFPEQTIENCLRELKPDIFVKGGDYTLETLNQDERKIVEEYGGKIIILPLIEGISTTNLIEKIKRMKV